MSHARWPFSHCCFAVAPATAACSRLFHTRAALFFTARSAYIPTAWLGPHGTGSLRCPIATFTAQQHQIDSRVVCVTFARLPELAAACCCLTPLLLLVLRQPAELHATFSEQCFVCRVTYYAAVVSLVTMLHAGMAAPQRDLRYAALHCMAALPLVVPGALSC